MRTFTGVPACSLEYAEVQIFSLGCADLWDNLDGPYKPIFVKINNNTATQQCSGGRPCVQTARRTGKQETFTQAMRIRRNDPSSEYSEMVSGLVTAFWKEGLEVQ